MLKHEDCYQASVITENPQSCC